MRKKLTSLFISAMTLSSLSLSINHSIAMEKEDKDIIDFASCLSDPNSNTFTEAFEKIIGSEDIEKHFLQYIRRASDSLHKKALLAIHKLWRLQGHMTIDLDPLSLFEIFSEGCKAYQESTVLTHCLAYCFEHEIGTKRDLKKAIELYEIAIQGGFSYSFSNLAHIYRDGHGVEKNIEKAIGLYEKAIEKGNESAMSCLFYIYTRGEEVGKNLSKVIELHEKTLEKGDVRSMYRLARLYETSEGKQVESNIPKAIGLYEKAITTGQLDNLRQSNAMYDLASIYIRQNDTPKSLKLLKEASNKGHHGAMHNLAMMYCGFGNHIEKDIPKAVELYGKAIEKGNVHSLNNLALMYQKGEGVEQNVSKAQELFEKAFLLKNRRYLPSFLCDNDKEDRLIEVECEHSNLFPDVSIEFSDMITSGAMSNKKRIQSIIELFIQKKYKEYILNESKYQILKDKREYISESFNFGTPSFANEDFFLKLKSNNSIVLKIAKELDPQSWAALSSTSRYFHKILSLRDIKIIKEELIGLRANFMNKMKKNRLTAFVEVGEIMDILCPKDTEIKDTIDFTSCLNKPKEIEKILASRDIQNRLFEFIKSPSSHDLPCKQTLLAFYKIFKLPGHMSINLTPDELFDIFSESLKTDQENDSLNHCLAKCFQDGIGTKKNLSKAIRMLEKAVQKEFIPSLNMLSHMYINDTNDYDLEKNYHKGLDLILKAIDLKSIQAIYSLAFMYFRGYEVKRNHYKGLKLCQKAADLGYVYAIDTLAVQYHNGFGVVQDYKKAFKLFKKAHESGSEKATALLGLCYEEGKGVEKNTEKAIELYNQAFKLNNIMAMNRLSAIYPEKAVELYKQAIDLGKTEGIVSLANAYKDGKVAEKDIGKALELYQEAVVLKNTSAMRELALLYLKGEDVQKDTQKALTLFQEAVKLGDRSSINHIALMHERGNDVEKDIEKAKELFKEACELGDLSYVEKLIELYKQKGASDDKKLLEIYKICFFEGSEKQKKYLPKFLCQNNEIKKLFELEFKYPELLPCFSLELAPFIKAKGNKIFIEATIESWIQRQYSKNLSIFSDPKKYNPLKIEKLFEYKKLPPFPSVNKDSLLAQLPKYLILLIAKNLSPRSLIALASTSRHFYQVLYERIIEIDIITKDLLRLELSFVSKLRKASLEQSITLRKIMDILEKK